MNSTVTDLILIANSQIAIYILRGTFYEHHEIGRRKLRIVVHTPSIVLFFGIRVPPPRLHRNMDSVTLEDGNGLVTIPPHVHHQVEKVLENPYTKL